MKFLLYLSFLFSLALSAQDELLDIGEFGEENTANTLFESGLAEKMENIIMSAEQLKIEGDGWVVKDLDAVWGPNGAATNFKILSGSSDLPGTAYFKFKVPDPRLCNIWVRYIDNFYGNIPFEVEISKNGKAIITQEFANGASMRKTDDLVQRVKMKQQYGNGWITAPQQFIWGVIIADLPAGELTLTLRKPDKQKGGEFHRNVDCFIITDKDKFMPHPGIVQPLYLRIIVDKKQPTPMYIKSGGMRPYEPWFVPVFHASASGLKIGNAAPERNAKIEPYLKPGEKSQWINIASLLAFGGVNKMSFVAVPLNKTLNKEFYYSLEFASAAREDAILYKVEREGNGSGFYVTIDPASRSLSSDIEDSRNALANAETAAMEYPRGKRPEKFPFSTQMSVNSNIDIVMPETLENELKTMALLGINNLSNLPVVSDNEIREKYGIRFFNTSNTYLWTLSNGCACSPNVEAMRKNLKIKLEDLKKSGLLDMTVSYWLMDEPGLGIKTLMNCKSTEKSDTKISENEDGLGVVSLSGTTRCTELFIEFLRENKITAKQLGLEKLENARLSDDITEGLLYYWSARYTSETLRRYMKTITELVNEIAPELRTGVNIATEIVYNGNMLQGGVNWFDVYDSAALTFGQTEDWSNEALTRQVCSYMTDVMRSACESKNTPFRMLNVLSQAWEFEAKAFSEIAHGARALHFFSYGPFYTGSADSRSTNSEIFAPIRRISYATGDVEQYLLNSKVARGDAALLFSATSDYWHIADGHNTLGKERMYLSLLLLHCGVRTDIIPEERLDTSLKKYKVLFATDSHLKAEYLTHLIEWVRDGGILYLSAGALEKNDLNEALGLNETLGLKRAQTEFVINVGRPQWELARMKPLENIQGLDVFCAKQQISSSEPWLGMDNYASVTTFGKGKIIALGFLPALSYLQGAKNVENPLFYSQRNFPEAPRNLMRKLVDEAGIQTRIFTNHPLVEANLAESPDADIITLSNWSGKEQEVSVTLNNVVNYKNVRGILNDVFDLNYKNGILIFKIKISAGDHIECLK